MKYTSLSKKVLKGIPDAELRADRNEIERKAGDGRYGSRARAMDELVIINAEIARRPKMKAEDRFK